MCYTPDVSNAHVSTIVPSLHTHFYNPQLYIPISLYPPHLGVYNSTSLRSKTTYIGSTGDDEMCNFYMMYYMPYSQVPHKYHTSTTQVPHKYHTSSTQVPHKYHTSTTQVPHKYHTSTTQVPHKYHTSTTQVPHKYHTSTTCPIARSSSPLVSLTSSHPHL